MVMMSLVTWVLVGMLSPTAGGVFRAEGGDISLCHLLENEDRQRREGFPAAYICIGPDSTSGCAPSKEWSPVPLPQAADANTFLLEGATGVPSPTDTQTSQVAKTWWACEGERAAVPSALKDQEGIEWISCNGYFAVSYDAPFRRDVCGLWTRHAARRLQEEGSEDHLGHDSGRRYHDDLNDESPDVTRAKLVLEDTRSPRVTRKTDMVPALGLDCDTSWRLWPAVHTAAISDGNVMVLKLFASVGNLFLMLGNAIKVASALEVGLILDWKPFPGFREAFDQSEIVWDLDPAPFVQRAEVIEKGNLGNDSHAKTYSDGAIVISDFQLSRLTSQLGANAGSTLSDLTNNPASMRRLVGALAVELRKSGDVRHAQACAWNLMLSRSPATVALMEMHNPWGEGRAPARYVAWHIRTPDGETARSYNPAIHQYILRESSEVVCDAFLDTMAETEKACPSLFGGDVMLYISSNSKSMARNCTATAAGRGITAGYVDMGLAPGESHTNFSKHPNASANAFVDFLYLIDASAVIRSGSSFSGTAMSIKGFVCKWSAGRASQGLTQTLRSCLPRTC